ncbi:hypothetical protein FHETE_1519 [Fusarium heterosporum]|uniref:DEUBAD domain-containing protein n=1 Tax=Fusarium heterosporum TaxID=42747 RepID=A0A8H5TV35_FUSHE|nr:hypothetical protein FHETE_1519 [Fusarium heterosporum]
MADEEEGTIVVGNRSASGAPQNASDSSPLSSAPEHEHADTTAKTDQLSGTPATSLKGQGTKPKMTKGRKKVVVKKTTRKSKWNASNILTDSKSPLASADLRSILSNQLTWDVLEKEEKAEILALFPDSQHILGAGTEDACPDFASLMNDDTFRYDCAAYTENISQGRHDPEWLEQAWAAHERRKMGDFDEYLDNRFKDEWEVELPPELKTTRKLVVVKEQSDVKMEGTEPVPDGNDNNADASLEDGAKDEEEIPNSDHKADKSEREDAVKEEPTVAAADQTKDSAMDIDGDDTKDELAGAE